MDTPSQASQTPVIHHLKNKSEFSTFASIAILIGSLFIGAAFGFGLSRIIPSSQSDSSVPQVGTKTTTSEGVKDNKQFPDHAEGTLKKGGVDGEGSHHLERPGGESQNVYLTSSVADLSKFVGKKVKVQGQTQKAQKAGWLMDVGYVEISQ